MYYPYLRGKQYELMTIREMAPLLARHDFRPLIEPVRRDLGSLQRALDSVRRHNGHAIVIVNPQCGELEDARGLTVDFLANNDLIGPHSAPGILLTQDISLERAIATHRHFAGFSPVLIHAGFTEPKGLAEALGTQAKSQRHAFIDRPSNGKLYQRHFKGAFRILVRDGFNRTKNKDYASVEPFSDLHVTYTEEGMDGFGDFLMVGDEFIEGGGPAHAVTIHVTFIDPDQDDAMQIYHFVSDSNSGPKDPAGKFSEALAKLMSTVDSQDSKVLKTTAIDEFRILHGQGHFPGLGYVKKLSMNHHIETLAQYFSAIE